jgi:hypothetical protein
MNFRYESEMTKPVERWLLSQGMQVKREYPTPWGICDLVGCSLNKNKVRKRLNLGQRRPIGSQFRVLLLSYIPDMQEDKAVNFAELHRRFANLLDESFIEKEVCRLIKDKFVQEVQSGVFQKLNGWFPLHKRIVAVELKLTRISEVISQAHSNLEFADESYVGLPYDNAKRLFASRDRRQLAEKGIGIIGVHREGIRVFLRSKFEGCANPISMMHCVERFWRTYLTSNLA